MKVIGVGNLKGGVGKTTTSTSLGVSPGKIRKESANGGCRCAGQCFQDDGGL